MTQGAQAHTISVRPDADKVLDLTHYWTPPVPPWQPLKKTLNSSLRMACVVEDRLYQGLRFEGDLLLLTPGNWKHVLKYGKPDFLLMESIWTTATGHWHMGQCPNAPGRDELLEIVALAGKLSIPSIFWITRDNEYHEHYKDIARYFDYVFCADPKEIELLQKEGITSRFLPPAVQPAIHNPIRVYGEHNRFKIDILYDGWIDSLQSPESIDVLRRVVKKHNLSIIESRHSLSKFQKERTSDFIQENILGCVSKKSLPSIIKYSNIYITLDPIQATLTASIWSALEAAACRVPIVHRGTLSKDDMRWGFVLQRPQDQDFLFELEQLTEDHIYRERQAQRAWRFAFHKNTYSHRIQKICNVLGICHDWEEYPKAAMITPTIRPQLFSKCLAQFEKQTYSSKELVVVYNGNPQDVEKEKAIFERKKDISFLSVPKDFYAGTCMNIGIQKSESEFVFRVDDDDHYGENYILDAMLYLRSVDADVFGKSFSFIKFENDGLFYNKKIEIDQPCLFRGLNLGGLNVHLAGCSIAGKKSFFIKHPYPNNNYASADIYIRNYINEFVPDAVCLKTDSMNMVVERKNDVTQHTWRVGFDQLAKRFVKSEINFKDIFVPPIPPDRIAIKKKSNCRIKLVFFGPLKFRTGVWDTRAKYILSDLFEVLSKDIHITMITGPIPSHAYDGFQYLNRSFNVDVFELPELRGGSKHNKIIESAWEFLNIIQPDILSNAFGATSFGYPLGILSYHFNSRMVLRSAGDEIFSRLSLGTYKKNSQQHFLDIEIEKNGFDLSHSIIAMSPWEQERIRNNCRSPEKVKVCLRGVDLQKFSPETENVHSINSKFKVLFVGRKSLEKGYDIVESVADAIFVQDSSIEFQFAGTFEKEKVNNKIYLGFVDSDELPDLYNRVDALILVSRTEGFPQVVAEAMACGKPCILSRRIFEGYIKDNSEAILVDLDIGQIVQKILFLKNNLGFFHILSKNARKLSENQLDKKVWQKIYRKIILGEDDFRDYNYLRFFT